MSKREEERLTTFDEIIEQVLEHEGGYVDDPADKGGATNFGVIQRTYQNYIDKYGDGHEVTKDEMKEMDEEAAIDCYFKMFWEPSRASKLPEEVREVYFDMVVNHGQGNAVKILQQAINNKRKPANYIDVDGGIGPNTIGASKGLKEWELMVERSGFYWNLVFKGSKYKDRTNQVKFIRGWIRRCFKLDV